LNILIDIGHPGHVHLYRKLSDALSAKGHNVYFTAKDKPAITEIMDGFGIPYTVLGKKYDHILLKYVSTAIHLARMHRLVRKKKIDIGIGISGLISFMSKYTAMKSICMDDDDSSITPLFAKSIKNADVILTPSALEKDYRGPAHITYEGYHELAYLHPANFSPDPEIPALMGIKKAEKYFFLRFNAFRAHHDSGEYGMNNRQKHVLIDLLQAHGKVFVSCEANDSEFKRFDPGIPPEKIHSAIYYAVLFVGDSQTMTSEAAVLGTPALKCNTFAGRLSIPNELEKDYKLCFSYQPGEFDNMINKIKELLQHENLKKEFQARRQKMLSEKIDVTAFLVWFIENYPESIRMVREEPEIQMRFR
jgi:predicted glycosyltransferase